MNKRTRVLLFILGGVVIIGLGILIGVAATGRLSGSADTDLSGLMNVQKVSFKGLVKDSAGKGIPGATVSIYTDGCVKLLLGKKCYNFTTVKTTNSSGYYGPVDIYNYAEKNIDLIGTVKWVPTHKFTVSATGYATYQSEAYSGLYSTANPPYPVKVIDFTLIKTGVSWVKAAWSAPACASVGGSISVDARTVTFTPENTSTAVPLSEADMLKLESGQAVSFNYIGKGVIKVTGTGSCTFQNKVTGQLTTQNGSGSYTGEITLLGQPQSNPQTINAVMNLQW